MVIVNFLYDHSYLDNKTQKKKYILMIIFVKNTLFWFIQEAFNNMILTRYEIDYLTRISCIGHIIIYNILFILTRYIIEEIQ